MSETKTETETWGSETETETETLGFETETETKTYRSETETETETFSSDIFLIFFDIFSLYYLFSKLTIGLMLW